MKTSIILTTLLSFSLFLNAQQFGAANVIAYEPVFDLNGVMNVDVDQDGDRDLVGLALSELSWYENLDGAGTFGPRQDIDLTNSPRSWYSGDMNGDGLEDLLIGDRDNDKVLFYANTGGGFAAPVTVATPDGPLGVHAADINDDGYTDLIYSSYKQIAYCAGDSAGAFASPVLVQNETFYEYFYGIISADFNNDGMMDLAYARNADDKVAYRINLGSGVFGSETLMLGNIQGVESLVAADIDNDGDMDVVGASNYVGSRVAYYRNTGTGTFSFRENITSAVNSPEGLSVVDLNDDGLKDVIVGSYYDDEIVWFNNTGGFFSSTKNVILDATYNILDLTVADIDMDGYPDVMASRYRLFEDDDYIWFKNLENNTCETSLIPSSPTAAIGASSVTLSWDPIPQSIGCQINATRTSPAGFSTTKRFAGFELSSVNVSFSALGNGTNWDWRVQCACTTSPLVLTNYSATTSFAVPAPRISAAIQLGPNPVTDYIQINSNLSDQVAIYNVSGELMFSGQVNGPIQVEVSDWTSGIYLVQFEENSDANQMLVVE